MRTRFTRRSFLRRAGIAVSASLVAACQPAVVEKVVEVEKEVTRLVPAKERIEFSWSGVLGWENFWVNGLFPKFREMHPEIDEMKFIPQTGTIADWTQQAMNMAAAGTLPDALNTSLGTEYHILSKTLVYVPLDDFVQRDNYDLSIHYEVGLTGCTVDGRLHGLPGNCQPGHVVLYYNPNLFDEAGIPYPTYEWSTEDATEAAMKLTKDTTGDGYTDQWGYAPPTSQTGICGWIRSYGGDALSEDSRTSTLDTK
ncbi:MAG: extracellular solute-binding protein, partial [Chloroflexi bacterium]|nr:extracellular solute-binding protein [Chloroflexota bacterium]